MLLLLLSACIENQFPEPPKDRSEDTGAPVEDTDDTDVSEDTAETDSPVDTDTGVPVDTDTGVPVDTDLPDTDIPDDSGVDTVDTDVDTGGGHTDEDTDVDLSPPGPITVSGECASGGSTWTGWTDSAATVPELNVVGVYESDAGYPGPAYVTVSRAEEMTLVLSSYAAVDWQVELAVGSNVTSILVSAYDVSTVTFTSVTTAPVTYVGWIGACAYEIPDRDPTSGCETPDLEAIVESRTSLAMSSFQGCYAGGEFAVE